MLGLRVKTSSANKKTCNGRKMHLEKTNKKKGKCGGGQMGKIVKSTFNQL